MKWRIVEVQRQNFKEVIEFLWVDLMDFKIILA
jgi:hypothetical protein